MNITGRDGLPLARGLGGRAAHAISACRSRASRTCSPSPGRAARRCCATCRSPSSSMSSGSPTASRTCAKHGLARIEPTPDAVERLGRAGERGGRMRRCCRRPHHSWYLGANVPGKPRVFMPYAGGMARYRRSATISPRAATRAFVSLPEPVLGHSPNGARPFPARLGSREPARAFFGASIVTRPGRFRPIGICSRVRPQHPVHEDRP
jgi:hypothetical protein